jgi:hypothetical protein
VKLLFDENLSRKLAVFLADLHPQSARVAEFDLLETADRKTWDFAQKNEFVILSTDSDFYELATTLGCRQEWSGSDVGRIQRGIPSGSCAGEAIRINEFLAEPELAVLILERD